jgi:hypothetical protein
VLNGPSIISSFFAALLDFYLLKLVELTIGKKYIKIVIMLNYFNIYSYNNISKTLINNFEAALLTVSFYFWLLSVQKRIKNNSCPIPLNTEEFICRILVMWSFTARSTSIIPWIFIWITYVLCLKKSAKTSILHHVKIQAKLVCKNVIFLIVMVSICIIIDSLYYK